MPPRRADGMRYGDQMFSRSPWAQDTQVEQDEPDLPTAPEDDAWSDLVCTFYITTEDSFCSYLSASGAHYRGGICKYHVGIS
jgi:hypothetical protein